MVDPGTYVLRHGKPTRDPRRDAAYTRELGNLLLESYARETVVMTTQLVAHVLFRRLVRETPGVDLFGRLRFRGEIRMGIEELVRDLGETRDRAARLEAEGAVHLSPAVRDERPEDLLRRAMRLWDGYHRRTVARQLGTEVVAEDPTLLLYYQNRLVDFANSLASTEDQAGAREIALLGISP